MQHPATHPDKMVYFAGECMLRPLVNISLIHVRAGEYVYLFKLQGRCTDSQARRTLWLFCSHVCSLLSLRASKLPQPAT